MLFWPIKSKCTSYVHFPVDITGYRFPSTLADDTAILTMHDDADIAS